MKEKNNATCSICGKGYYKCNSCKDMMSLNPWKRHTDTSEHFKIYQVIHGYSTGVYTKHEAMIKLQIIDLSDFDSLRDNIKGIINDIMSETVNKENESIVIAETEDDCMQSEVTALEECVEESPVAVKTSISRKRRSYKTVETE